MRARDALGRPVPVGAPTAVEPVPSLALPPADAVRAARDLLERGRAFAAHEILEASWKAAPAAERPLWQGLAQLCVGVTHLQRGNRVGAARLLRRGSDLLRSLRPVYGVDLPAVLRMAERLADEVEAGGEPRTVLRL